MNSTEEEETTRLSPEATAEPAAADEDPREVNEVTSSDPTTLENKPDEEIATVVRDEHTTTAVPAPDSSLAQGDLLEVGHKEEAKEEEFASRDSDGPQSLEAEDGHEQQSTVGEVPTSSGRSETLLLGLPMDSLHSVASFLTPAEWANFGLTSKGSTRICREIFHKVKMHGFRCATEVVTAWKLKHLADARELCSLYIAAGVPVYPYSLGHSYHTLMWRMRIEVKEMDGIPDSSNDSNEATPEEEAPPRRPTDPFYTERQDFVARATRPMREAPTYLEEKSVFQLGLVGDSKDTAQLANSLRRQMSLVPQRAPMRPPTDPREPQHNNNNLAGGAQDRGAGLGDFAALPLRRHGMEPPPRRGVTRSNSHSEPRSRKPKVVVKLHRHLLDQHLLGHPSFKHTNTRTMAPPPSLSIDFFHPHFNFQNSRSMSGSTPSTFASSDGYVSGDLIPSVSTRSYTPEINSGLASIGSGLTGMIPHPLANLSQQAGAAFDQTSDDSDSDGEAPIQQVDTLLQAPMDAEVGGDDLPEPESYLALLNNPAPESPIYPSVISSIDLDVYSAASLSKADQSDNRELRNYLRARFVSYERRLETCLSHHDTNGFDEAVLDFWDEFLPNTAMIHYYDLQTAVPRTSCLDKFLSKPCPKSIGVVQCEIERIKLGAKKKGGGMKGRFFPTYEYRLFIRHQTQETEDSPAAERRDTVLMVARNRGRKEMELAGSPAVTGKKGSNNYFLYTPTLGDVCEHYGSVNEKHEDHFIPNGASNRPAQKFDNRLMGRLQSNFIGTEFQIYTPKGDQRKMATKNQPQRSCTTPIKSALNGAGSSDEEFGYDSSDTRSSGKRRSRFGRLTRRRSGANASAEPTPVTEDESSSHRRSNARAMRRSRSSGDVQEQRRTRTSRRAIANNSDSHDVRRVPPAMMEEEDGAITYTANLLGSRPRIMDVCLPKVDDRGCTGAEWKKYLDMSAADIESGTGNKMLNHLKQLQQRMDSLDQPRLTQAFANNIDPTMENDEYTPPDDFGLLALQNRPPWWNVELGSFVLNFGGRVSVASVKNFQLCDRTDQEYIMLQFGRIQGRHSFTMDFQHPLTAVQAFAIAISSLQSKISFG